MLAKDEVLRLLISLAKASSVVEVRVTPLRVRLLLLLLKDPAIIRASVRAEAVTPPNAFNSAADCAADAARSLVKVSVLPSRPVISRVRSEEHTSELQSRGHLVCRLLLENKK